MTSEQMQEQLRSRQAAHLRACFPNLSERDLMLLLCAPSRRAVYILQQSFGCAMEDAKAAWNDYVLRYIDGASPAGSQWAAPSEPPARLL